MSASSVEPFFNPATIAGFSYTKKQVRISATLASMNFI